MSNRASPTELSQKIEGLISDNLAFSLRVKAQLYGDDKTFHEYKIIMRKGGVVVGGESGPSRVHTNPDNARSAGRQRISNLRRHQLIAINVTKEDIENGESRSCSSCAIAQALWRMQAGFGLDQWRYDFRVEPYGCCVDVDGIILEDKSHPYQMLMTGEQGMPDLVVAGDPTYTESMYEWTSRWDEWAESRHMTAKEWREEHDDIKPYKPSPCSFVLNLTEMKPEFP